MLDVYPFGQEDKEEEEIDEEEEETSIELRCVQVDSNKIESLDAMVNCGIAGTPIGKQKEFPCKVFAKAYRADDGVMLVEIDLQVNMRHITPWEPTIQMPDLSIMMDRDPDVRFDFKDGISVPVHWIVFTMHQEGGENKFWEEVICKATSNKGSLPVFKLLARDNVNQSFSFHSVICFLYKNEFLVGFDFDDMESVFATLYATDYMGLTKVKMLLEARMVRSGAITSKEAVDILRFAKQYNCSLLIDEVMQCAASKLGLLVKTEFMEEFTDELYRNLI